MLKQEELTQRNSSRIQTTRIQARQLLITPITNVQKRHRSFCSSFAASCIIAISGICIGYGLSQTAPILPTTLGTRWQLSFNPQICATLIVGIPALAAMIGAALTKATLALLSRKLSIVCGAIIVIIGSLIMYIPYQQGLLIGRIIEGIGIGFQMGMAGIYLRDVSPKQLRSIMSPLISLGITLGSLLCYFIQTMMSLSPSFSNPGDQASVLITFNGVFCLLQIILLLLFVPDSPVQKIALGKFQQAKIILRSMYLDKFVEQQFNQLKGQVDIAKRKLAAASNQMNQSFQKNKIFQKKQNNAQRVAIFVGLYRQLNGGISVLTYIGPILLNVIAISQEGQITYVPIICALVSFVGNVLGVFWIANKVGRKPLFIITSVIFTITNIGSGISMQQKVILPVFILSIISMFVYGAFSLAPGWTYPNQVVLPQRVALQNSLTGLGLAIALFLNPIILFVMPNKNAFPVFYIYACINFIAFFVFTFFLVESKGRTYKQIIQDY